MTKISSRNILLFIGAWALLPIALWSAGHAVPPYTQSSLGSGSSVAAQSSDAQVGVCRPVKNVILLIGDGMGLAHVSGVMASSSEPLALQRAESIGLIRTSSANRYVTDSAAAGTALSAGTKTNNGVVGQNAGGEAIPSMLAYAIQAGKSTGIVVTSSITHATPASFYAHNKTRRDELTIAEDFIDSKIDVAIGGGRKFFEARADERMLTDQLKEKGYVVAYSIEDVLKAPAQRRLVGLLADVALPKANEQRGPILAKATRKALEILNTNSEGFILMVEGSQIDWAGHRNDWDYALAEIKDFDSVIKVAMDYADANPGTLVVVTADHETGGLSLIDGDLGQGSVIPRWAAQSHTGIMVPVYAYGSGAEGFSGIYENTDVFVRILKALGISKENAPPVKNSKSQTSDSNLSSPNASIGQP